VASCVLRPGDARKLDGLTDSKLLTERARDRMYDLVLARAVDYAIVVIPAAEVDAFGVHFTNIEGMRRAVARLTTHPGYVLVDGFRVAGLTAPSMPVVKGDRAAACVAAASVLAKVTRDRIMVDLHQRLPKYGFDVHKGYCTAEHAAALDLHGPTADHRWSYANVVAAAMRHGMSAPRRVARSVSALGVVQNGGPSTDEVNSSPVSRGGARIP
jgi:ribonuclease HII